MSEQSSISRIAENVFPFLRWLKSYSITTLFQDALSGATLASILIPQAMSYALLAMLPPVAGLYSTVFSAMAHLVFGISPYQSLGPFALVSLMTGNAIMSMALTLTQSGSNSTSSLHAQQDEPWVTYPILIPLSEILTVTVAMILFLMFLTKAGKLLKELLPDSLVKGFTGAAAISIATSQAKLIFGVKIVPITGTCIVIRTWWAILSALPESFQLVTMLIGLSSMGVVVVLEYLEAHWADLLKRLVGGRQYILLSSPTATSNEPEHVQAPPVEALPQKKGVGLPKILISLVLMTGISYLARVNEKYMTALVGDVQSGLPDFNSPFRIFSMVTDSSILLELILAILINAMAISLVSYVTLLSIIQTFPSPNNDGNSNIDSASHQVRATAMALQSSPTRAVTLQPEEEHQRLISAESGGHNANHQHNTDDISIPPSNTIVVTESLSAQRRQYLKVWEEEDNELLALSVASLLCSCCSGFVASGSLSRSAILSTLHSNSPLANATASIFVVITVFFLTSLIYWVPLTCLAAVIIISLVATIQKIGPQARGYWKSAKEKNGWKEWRDFSLWATTFIAVVVFDPCIGIVVGMGLATAWKVWKRFF